MIEIMCRDGKTSSADMDKIAAMIFQATGIETNVIQEEDRRAMVFWGPTDVPDTAIGMKFASFDIEDEVVCNRIIKIAEPKIHQAMLEAGRDALFDVICEYAETMGEDLSFDDNEDSSSYPIAEA